MTLLRRCQLELASRWVRQQPGPFGVDAPAPPGVEGDDAMTTELLTAHQLTVARKVLAEESARREHLVVSLSGAHAYGFPSPD